MGIISSPARRRGAIWLGCLLLLLLPCPARAQSRGGEGESCQARKDCQEGLRCYNEVCLAPKKPGCKQDADCGAGHACRAGSCAGTGARARTNEASAGGWTDFALEGTHFFGGVTFAPGMTGYWNYGGPVVVESAFFFAMRLGVLFDRTELALEIAPRTWLWDFDPSLSSFSLNVSIGGLLKLGRRVYWPIRFGLGFSAGDLPIKDVYMQGRLDLIGLVFQHGHLLFEINLPSTRFSSELRHVGIWSWLFNVSVSYVI